MTAPTLLNLIEKLNQINEFLEQEEGWMEEGAQVHTEGQEKMKELSANREKGPMTAACV